MNNNKIMIFIANGLGMAINKELFSLKKGVKNGLNKLNLNEKNTIASFISLYNAKKINPNDLTKCINEKNNCLAYINMIFMLTRMIKTTKGSLKNKWLCRKFKF